jgi:hypothetical protein
MVLTNTQNASSFLGSCFSFYLFVYVVINVFLKKFKTSILHLLCKNKIKFPLYSSIIILQKNLHGHSFLIASFPKDFLKNSSSTTILHFDVCYRLLLDMEMMEALDLCSELLFILTWWCCWTHNATVVHMLLLLLLLCTCCWWCYWPLHCRKFDSKFQVPNSNVAPLDFLSISFSYTYWFRATTNVAIYFWALTSFQLLSFFLMQHFFIILTNAIITPRFHLVKNWCLYMLLLLLQTYCC